MPGSREVRSRRPGSKLDSGGGPQDSGGTRGAGHCVYIMKFGAQTQSSWTMFNCPHVGMSAILSAHRIVFVGAVYIPDDADFKNVFMYYSNVPLFLFCSVCHVVENRRQLNVVVHPRDAQRQYMLLKSFNEWTQVMGAVQMTHTYNSVKNILH